MFKAAAADQTIAPADSEQINRALAELTIRIRQDLVGDQDVSAGVSANRIRNQVHDNVEAAMVDSNSLALSDANANDD